MLCCGPFPCCAVISFQPPGRPGTLGSSARTWGRSSRGPCQWVNVSPSSTCTRHDTLAGTRWQRETGQLSGTTILEGHRESPWFFPPIMWQFLGFQQTKMYYERISLAGLLSPLLIPLRLGCWPKHRARYLLLILYSLDSTVCVNFLLSRSILLELYFIHPKHLLVEHTLVGNQRHI